MPVTLNHRADFTIGELFAVNAAEIPDEEWYKLPLDLSSNWHRYRSGDFEGVASPLPASREEGEESVRLGPAYRAAACLPARCRR